jgi:uncharacterized protein YydD (DUF2326 family)
MIVSISSSIPTFKKIKFKAGLNILLADITTRSTAKQTRNSAGKTSMIEIMHFLMGSEADKESLFKKPEIIGHSFTGVFILKRQEVSVTRSACDERKVLIEREVATRIGVPIQTTEAGVDYVSLDDWRRFLGNAWFKMPMDREGFDFEGTFAPSFRSSINYLVRRRRSGGYAEIYKTSTYQQPWDWQVNLSYLLGLDWHVPQAMQDLRARMNGLSTLRKAIKAGELGTIFGTAAEIRPELVRTEERIVQLKNRMDNFRVLDSYRELAAEVAQLKNKMSEIAGELTLVNETISFLENAIKDEKPPAYAAVDALYRAAGVELPDVALRRFDEVRDFQESVVSNRRRYLDEEIAEASTSRTSLEKGLAEADRRKAELLATLDGKGAFEDLMAIHEEFAAMTNRAEILRTKLQNANILENKAAQTKRDSADLEIRLQQDHERNENAIKYATVKVDHAIAELYDDRTGNLVIAATKNGPQIEIAIQGDGNLGGIDMMKIFCFDSMLFEAVSDRLEGPRFFVHDSHLFDGVDARQVRGAILFGAKTADAHSGQYIIAMNSDELEASGAASAPMVIDGILPVRLTDDERGGLFGFRFD